MGWLYRLNPLAKVIALAPVLAVVALTTDPFAPLAFTALALVLLASSRVPLRSALYALAPMLLVLLGFVVLYPFLIRRELVSHTPTLLQVGGVPIYEGAIMAGLRAGLRIIALVSLALLFNLTTDVSDFMRALVQQARLPYRIGYSIMVALRFAPLLRYELELIRSAHRVRGIGQPGLLGDFAQLRRAIVPLLASSIRRAERAALAMDGRAFGAFSTRTHFRRVRLTPLDGAFVLAFWALVALVMLALQALGVLGPLSFVQRV
ncbi:MAG: energy-coupling factor transporter transmembrane component T [Anaerolineae bacterium]|nr:energy-coupling factor transporter transmembrane component T [Anaerolineae bacterium]